MPRPLIKNIRSQPPNFIVKEQCKTCKKQENSENKKILGNFEHISRIYNQPANSQAQIEPKRRAAKDGFIKTIEAKIAQNTSIKQLGPESNFKQKIYEIEQNRKSNATGYRSEAIKGNIPSSKGYRLRR